MKLLRGARGACSLAIPLAACYDACGIWKSLSRGHSLSETKSKRIRVAGVRNAALPVRRAWHFDGMADAADSSGNGPRNGVRNHMTRQRFWTVVAAAGAVGLIAFAARSMLSSVGSEPETIALVKPLMCASCGHRYEGEVSRPPLKCPKCSQETVWPAIKCTKCGTVLACDRRKFRNEGRDPCCPKCNSTQLTSVQSGG